MTFTTSPNHTRIKFCGITNKEDLQNAVLAGADALGFVFVDASPRKLNSNFDNLPDIQKLMANTPAFVSNVALVVNPAPEKVELIKKLPIDLYQFHGDETADECKNIAQNKRWIKALQVKPNLDIVNLALTYTKAGASGILLDGYDPNQPNVKGGTGKAFDWHIIKELTNKIDCPIIMAGGLTPDNINLAVNTAQPFAVDVSGGIEAKDNQGKTIKGKKDKNLMMQFVQNIKHS